MMSLYQLLSMQRRQSIMPIIAASFSATPLGCKLREMLAKIKKLTAVYIINSALAEFYNYNQQKSKPKFLLQASLVEVPGSWYAANNRHKVDQNLNFWSYIQLDNCTYILVQHTVYLLKRKSKFGRILLSFMTYLYCLNPENILRRGLPIVSSCLCGQRGL